MAIHHELPRLSAQSLRVLDQCPRKFALRYRLNRYWPAVDPGTLDASRSRKTWIGDGFHRLVEAKQLGLDCQRMLEGLEADLPGLSELWDRFQASEHGAIPPGVEAWTEQTLHFTLGGAPFMVRYDRLVKEGDRWTILDWKTGEVKAASLRTEWQTKLYLFALVEAGSALGKGTISPEQVSLVYWEVGKGIGHVIAYDAATHEALRRELTAKAREALRPFDPELPDDPAYPRRPGHCPHCVFDSLCNTDRTRELPAEPPLPRFTLPPDGNEAF